MADAKQKPEAMVFPDYDLIVLVSGELRELCCAEIPAYWYTFLELQKREAA